MKYKLLYVLSMIFLLFAGIGSAATGEVKISIDNAKPVLTQGEALDITGEVINDLNVNIYDVKATFNIPALGITETKSVDKLKRGDRIKVYLKNTLSPTALLGKHKVSFTVEYLDTFAENKKSQKVTLYKSTTITVESLAEKILPPMPFIYNIKFLPNVMPGKFPTIENFPPVLTAIGSKTVKVGETLTFTVSAIDLDKDALTYSAAVLPAGAKFENQAFTWMPVASQIGVYKVTFKVSDGKAEDSEEITITVTEVPIVLTDAEKVKQLEDKFKKYENEYDDLKDEIEDARETNDEDEEDNLIDELKDLKKDLDTLDDDVDALQAQISNNDLEEDLNDIEDDIKELKEKIDKVIKNDDDNDSASTGGNSNSASYTPSSTTQTKPKTTPKEDVQVQTVASQLPQNTQSLPVETKFTETSTYIALLISGFVLMLGIIIFLVMILVRMF